MQNQPYSALNAKPQEPRLHRRGPRFVGSRSGGYAESLEPVFALARWRGMGRAGRAKRADAAQGVTGSQVAIEVAPRAGRRLAERGQLDTDRASGWRLILKPDGKGEGRRHRFKAVWWCAARSGWGWGSTCASFVPGATARPRSGCGRSGDNAGLRRGERRAGELERG